MKKIYILLAAAAFSTPALADPPTMVGRLSLIDGSASIRSGYDRQWTPAGINYPVIAGDAVWSAEGSRAEVEFGIAQARLDQISEMDVDRLDDIGDASFRIAQGVLSLTVNRVPPDGIMLTTAVGQLSIRQPGEYHIDAGRPNGPPTQLLFGVLQGEATFSGLRGTVELHGGQGAMVPPDQSDLTIVSVYPTDFDRWAEDRNITPRPGIAYVGDSDAPYDMPGYRDLTVYGTWEDVPEYGPVWYPSAIDIGWAPYRYGHWGFVRPWGWTWIDDAPWGWAPFHYGRWCQFNGRWGWIPGDLHERHRYAPALVAFVGGEPGEHFGVGVGWVPLGPHEPFHPYYEHSDRYMWELNRAHFHDEREFRDRDSHWHGPNATVDNFANHHAVTQVSAATFTGGAPVHQNLAPSQPGPNRGPAPVMNDFNHLPQQPAPRPQPAAAQPGQPAPLSQPQLPSGAHPGSWQQPAQPQQQQQPQPRPQRSEPREVPGQAQPSRPTAIPQQAPQQMPQYHPPQPVQQPKPQQQPQPQQQQRPQPQQQQESHPQQHQQEKDPKRDR